MATAARSFFDTNVLVYLFDTSSPDKRRCSIDLFARHAAAGSLVVSAQVLLEFYAVVTRKFAQAMPPEEASREVLELAKWAPVPVDAELVAAAVERSHRSQISIWDATIVEAALRSGCATLYSEDLQDGWVIDGRLRVVNPFI